MDSINMSTIFSALLREIPITVVFYLFLRYVNDQIREVTTIFASHLKEQNDLLRSCIERKEMLSDILTTHAIQDSKRDI